LLYTGWSRYWGRNRYFSNYPVLSENAAGWLQRFNLKGVGFDTISADSAGSTADPVHKRLLSRNGLIIENLTRLETLPQTGFTFSCLPLFTENADGSPVRAVAMIDPVRYSVY